MTSLKSEADRRHSPAHQQQQQQLPAKDESLTRVARNLSLFTAAASETAQQKTLPPGLSVAKKRDDSLAAEKQKKQSTLSPFFAPASKSAPKQSPEAEAACEKGPKKCTHSSCKYAKHMYSIQPELVCGICQSVLNNPISLAPCMHSYCVVCWMQLCKVITDKRREEEEEMQSQSFSSPSLIPLVDQVRFSNPISDSGQSRPSLSRIIVFGEGTFPLVQGVEITRPVSMASLIAAQSNWAAAAALRSTEAKEQKAATVAQVDTSKLPMDAPCPICRKQPTSVNLNHTLKSIVDKIDPMNKIASAQSEMEHFHKERKEKEAVIKSAKEIIGQKLLACDRAFWSKYVKPDAAIARSIASQGASSSEMSAKKGGQPQVFLVKVRSVSDVVMVSALQEIISEVEATDVNLKMSDRLFFHDGHIVYLTAGYTQRDYMDDIVNGSCNDVHME